MISVKMIIKEIVIRMIIIMMLLKKKKEIPITLTILRATHQTKKKIIYLLYPYYIVNRPGEDRAALQSPLSLTD